MFKDLHEQELISTNGGGLGALIVLVVIIGGALVSCQNNCDCKDCK